MGTLRPLARCSSAPPAPVSASAAAQRTIDAKRETRERIRALWPELSWRKRAAKLRVHESTLRGQLDERVGNRKPSDKVLRMIEWFEGMASLSGKIGAVG